MPINSNNGRIIGICGFEISSVYFQQRTKQANYNQARTLTVGTVEAGAIPEALASTALGTMRARYAELVSKTNELASALGPSHPQMQAARSQAAGMRAVWFNPAGKDWEADRLPDAEIRSLSDLPAVLARWNAPSN